MQLQLATPRRKQPITVSDDGPTPAAPGTITYMQVDAFKVGRSLKPGTVIASPPDLATVANDPSNYLAWYREALALAYSMTSSQGVCIIRCTDRKHRGRLLSKATTANMMAQWESMNVLWHKIELHRDPGKTDLMRPTYSHLLAYAHHTRPGTAWPDVLPPTGRLYADALNVGAALQLARYAANYPGPHYDLFGGWGTTSHALAAIGTNSIYIENDPDQVAAAKSVTRTTHPTTTPSV